MSTIHTLESTTTPSTLNRRGAVRGLQHVGSVLAGLVSIVAASTIVDAACRALGLFPPVDAPPMADGLFLLALAYRATIGVGGSYLTARLAPARPMRNALVLGTLGLCLGAAGTAANWGVGPLWYALGVTASAVPCAALGGYLALQRHVMQVFRRDHPCSPSPSATS